MNKNLWKPNKERILATLHGEIPDRVPYFESLIEDRIVTHILGRNVGSSMAASRGASDNDTSILPPMDPNDYLELIEYTGQDSILMESLWVPMKRKEKDGSLHSITGGFVNSWDDLEKVILPTMKDDILPRKEYLDAYIKAGRKNNVAVTFFTAAPFQYLYEYLIGFENFCVMAYENRELLEKCMDLAMDYYLKIVEMAIDSGIDILWIADDVAYKAGTFVSPDMFKDLWLHRIRKLIVMAEQANIPVVFHSCGNLNDIIDSVICEMGISCLHPIEPYSMDIYAIKEKYQDRFCIAGNIDIAGPLAFGTPKEAYAEAEKLVCGLKQGGKYIFASSHSITNDVPPENFDAMLQALKDNGVY